MTHEVRALSGSRVVRGALGHSRVGRRPPARAVRCGALALALGRPLRPALRAPSPSFWCAPSPPPVEPRTHPAEGRAAEGRERRGGVAREESRQQRCEEERARQRVGADELRASTVRRLRGGAGAGGRGRGRGAGRGGVGRGGAGWGGVGGVVEDRERQKVAGGGGAGRTAARASTAEIEASRPLPRTGRLRTRTRLRTPSGGSHASAAPRTSAGSRFTYSAWMARSGL